MESPDFEPFYLISGDCSGRILRLLPAPAMLYYFIHPRLLSVAQHQREVELANKGLGISHEPIRDYVRGEDAA